MSASDLSVGDALVAAGYPVLVDPDEREPRAGRWLPLAEVRRPERVLDLVERYTAWLGVPHRAAGGACASQHYAGRVAGYLVGTWALTGGIVPLEDPRVLAEVDEHGRTLRLVVPRHPQPAPGGVGELVRGLQNHLAPLLDVVRVTAGITSRLAWGGVATSVAGAFSRAVVTVPSARRAEVVSGAHRALDPVQWPGGRPLVTPAADATSHRRHTCCLIFLSADHEECRTCPRHARLQP
ncbi:(2Fe-2S)-binding protein [Arsenicicoccus dermatophilus]|uniref:(2Fe-2S)-binding protein n=1 Tax=Arsenicicoccus dermatophilus TaxID=1076331 RepID=UPI003916F7E2